MLFCFIGFATRNTITSDSTGSYLAVADGYSGYMYTSSDYGVTWTSRTNSAGARTW